MRTSSVLTPLLQNKTRCHVPRLLSFLPVFALLLLSACGQSNQEFEPGPPAGWQGEDGRWWQEGVDTSLAFRDMESFESMGVDEMPTFAESGRISRGAVAQSVKQSLINLYRNEPEVIDSLFIAHVVPDIRDAQLTSATEDVDRLKKEGYRTLGRVFQEPRTSRRLGEDIQVAYPDSLRRAGVSGRVRMQVYIDEEGEPRAIKLIESVHPVLDDIAMKATTEMRWRPAYLLRRGNWNEIPSWSRFNINFASGE